MSETPGPQVEISPTVLSRDQLLEKAHALRSNLTSSSGSISNDVPMMA